MGEIKHEIKKLPLNEIFTFKPKAEPIEGDARKKIIRLITGKPEPKVGKYPTLLNMEPFIAVTTPNVSGSDLKLGIDWVPMNDEGSLVKRIKKTCYKDYKLKLTPQILEKIGMVIAEGTVATKEYALDITKTFDWQAGDFGDAGSCFFQGRAGIRMDMMENGGFSAVRFFTRDFLGIRQGVGKHHKDYAGIGRAWIWKANVKVKVKDAGENIVIDTETYVVFNGYGPNTHWQAQFLAAYIGLPMKKISLANQERTSAGLWVNNGVGYVIGEPELIKDITKLDVGLKETYCRRANKGFE